MSAPLAMPAGALSMPEGADDPSGRNNLRLLVHLRWIAVAGQVASVAVVTLLFGVELPLVQMGLVVLRLVALNITSLARLRTSAPVTSAEILLSLLVDVAALTMQLYLSGGADNPFAFLFVLQLALASLMLGVRSAGLLLAVTIICFLLLVFFRLPLPMLEIRLAGSVSVQTLGLFICFALSAALIVVFVTRVNVNIRERDKRLADLRQRAAEEDHIVRMGLLASGAAHELGTPLSTLAIILGDWRRMDAAELSPALMGEIETMQAEVQRCKAIVSGILLSAGEARVESAEPTTLAPFFDRLAEEWTQRHPGMRFVYRRDLDDDRSVVLDSTLRQAIVNILENAFEVSPDWIRFTVLETDETLLVRTEDCGPGFDPAVLRALGRPYQSTKGRPGRGLGLFFAVNTLRKLGGNVEASQRPEGGAAVTLYLPLRPLMISRGR